MVILFKDEDNNGSLAVDKISYAEFKSDDGKVGYMWLIASEGDSYTVSKAINEYDSTDLGFLSRTECDYLIQQLYTDNKLDLRKYVVRLDDEDEMDPYFQNLPDES